MPDFSEYFAKTKGTAIQYQGKTLVMVDDLPFEDGDRFLFRIEKTNSDWKQGIGLDIFGHFEVDGKKYLERVALWEGDAPAGTVLTLFKNKERRSSPKNLPPKGLLGIKNIWDTGRGSIESWYRGAAMIVEEIENGRRYRCNDGHPDDNFDDIIFIVQKL